jgi:hypothetical protein
MGQRDYINFGGTVGLCSILLHSLIVKVEELWWGVFVRLKGMDVCVRAGPLTAILTGCPRHLTPKT